MNDQYHDGHVRIREGVGEGVEEMLRGMGGGGGGAYGKGIGGVKFLTSCQADVNINIRF